MSPTVVALSDGRLMTRGRHTGEVFNRAVLVDDKYVVITVCGKAVVYDYDLFDAFGVRTWTESGEDYPSHGNMYMHRFIMGKSNDPMRPSVDHINRVKSDNRRANLRFASQSEQNMNRATRIDKKPACQELQQHGISRLPRGIRRDDGKERYTCRDHRACEGKRNLNGTRHSGNSEAAKFKDCLLKYIAHLEADADASSVAAFNDLLRRLAQEHADIVRRAHEFDPEIPDGPYADMDDIDDDLTYARSLLPILTDVEIVRGAPNLEVQDVPVPDDERYVARIKGETVTLFDADFADDLVEINWEVGAAGPQVKKKNMPKKGLGEHVWCELAGRDIPPGYVLHNVDGQLYDVRIENLEVIETSKVVAKKTCDALIQVPDGVDIGMRYLPMGVTVNGTKVQVTKGLAQPNLESGGWSKSCASTADAKRKRECIFKAIRAIEEKQGAEAFRAENATYQRLRGEYDDIRARVMLHV